MGQPLGLPRRAEMGVERQGGTAALAGHLSGAFGEWRLHAEDPGARRDDAAPAGPQAPLCLLPDRACLVPQATGLNVV